MQSLDDKQGLSRIEIESLNWRFKSKLSLGISNLVQLG